MNPAGDHSPEIISTDKQYRKRLFSAYLLSLGLVIAAALILIPRLRTFLGTQYFRERLYIIEIVLILFLLAFIPAALFLISVGRKTLAAGRYPFPGMRVIRDTKVLTGKKASRIGKSLVYLGVVCIVLSVLGSVGTHFSFGWMRSFWRESFPGAYSRQPASQPLPSPPGNTEKKVGNTPQGFPDPI